MTMCDHFQIEVDNPLAILTQDTARMFLANSTAKNKYAVSYLVTIVFFKRDAVGAIKR